jgi:hypothetical protein
MENKAIVIDWHELKGRSYGDQLVKELTKLGYETHRYLYAWEYLSEFSPYREYILFGKKMPDSDQNVSLLFFRLFNKTYYNGHYCVSRLLKFGLDKYEQEMNKEISTIRKIKEKVPRAKIITYGSIPDELQWYFKTFIDERNKIPPRLVERWNLIERILAKDNLTFIPLAFRDSEDCLLSEIPKIQK